MKKYDCSKTLDYIHEQGRMCNDTRCEGCPFRNINCAFVSDITQEHIDIVQKWSDEHPEAPELTNREYEFLSAFVPHIEGRAIERTAKGLYIVFHRASNEERDGHYIDPNLFSFIPVGEEWSFDKLLSLEVEDE